MRKLLFLSLVVLAGLSMAADRTVLFEYFTQTG